MKPAMYITTSWDDGHPLDFRVAELLAKFGLTGTFYIPMIAEYETMAAARMRELSYDFEIGAHTMHHVELTEAPENEARREIADSKSWVEENTGSACTMFCPPRGKYSRRHLDLVQQAGFMGMRTVELMSVDFPRQSAGLAVLPTTLQAHGHNMSAYVRNALKRRSLRNLWFCLSHIPSLANGGDWAGQVRSLLPQALGHGGVFHLWGHSWEIEKNGQWQQLEEVFQLLSQFTRHAPALTNSQICRAVPPGGLATAIGQ